MRNFQNVLSFISHGTLFNRLLASKKLDPAEVERLRRIKSFWEFYEGYHWNEINTDAEAGEASEVTINYCRAFVNKFVAFELGAAFTINLTKHIANLKVTAEGRTMQQFLEDVWVDNQRGTLCTELGQSKSVTGDAWLKVTFLPSGSDGLDDSFGEYPQGKISISVVPTLYVNAKYNQHNKDRLEEVTVQYIIEVERGFITLKPKEVLYQEVWTREEVVYYEDGNETDRIVNLYGVIPFVQIKNFPIQGKTYGASDIEDIIPMNVEFNLKKSNVSEIIDYHAAPITVVFGAKIGNLEKGANKVWGGMPKEGRVENLHMQGDVTAATVYTKTLKTEMCEVAGIPESVLGGVQAVSNTSGVAMQYMNLPLIERTQVKRALTRNGLEKINKLILHIALHEGLITKPESTTVAEVFEDGGIQGRREVTIPVTSSEFYYSEVVLPDTLPKDKLMEMQQIQMELSLGLESRPGALQRLGREDIPSKLAEIDEDRRLHPDFYGLTPVDDNEATTNDGNADERGENRQREINPGMLNGEYAHQLVEQTPGSL